MGGVRRGERRVGWEWGGECISVRRVPQGSYLTTLPIYFYLFPVLLVNAVLQPTEWREGRAEGGRGETRRTAGRERGADRMTPAMLLEY